MKDSLTTAGEILGAVLIVAGMWQFSRGAALIVGGLLLGFLSWLVDR